MSRYYKLAQKEHPLAVRIVAVLFAGVLIVYLIPRFIINQGRALDELLGLSDLYFGAINLLIGGLLALAGLSLGLWSVLDQFERGRGTPLPFMPTQELLVSGPFRYCRNPMTLGTIVFYLGIAIAAGTLCGALIALLIGAGLITYLKRFEERELEERFGEAYVRYKSEVPFMIPKRPVDR